jgi:uncharacterized membrane protein (DUF485 family)
MRSPAPGGRPGDNEDAPFGGTADNPYLTESGAPDYVAIQQSEEFVRLRRLLTRFIFPMTAVFLVWYMAYVLLAAYDHSLMSRKVFGEINVGIILGLLQFVSTILITLAYARFARNRFDPDVTALREQVGVPEK